MPGVLVAALFAAALPNAVVLQPVANMYSKPTLDADVASQAIFAANVSIVERKDDWANVRTADDYTGWMPLSSLRPGPLYAVSGRVAEVRSMEVSAEPAEPSQWAKVRLPDDRAGWVQLGDVAFHAPPLTVPEMVEFAKRFLGLPYTWGGTSTYGYDCSGFIQMLERSRGLNMPRDAQPQADWDGQSAVERRDLQPGDLLYFGSSPKRITHTGMYLGGGKFISATTYQTPTIRIDDLEDPHFSRILAAMRRPK
jgi:cell wall-associated NlpC family hydrolase